MNQSSGEMSDKNLIKENLQSRIISRSERTTEIERKNTRSLQSLKKLSANKRQTEK